MASACSQSQSNGNLSLPAAGLGEQHIGDVGASDHQHKEHRYLEYPECLPEISRIEVANRRHPGTPVPVCFWILLCQLRGQGFHFLLRLRQTYSRPQACNHVQEVKPPALKPVRRNQQRSPEIDESAGMGEVRRHHAYDRVHITVQLNRTAYHLSIRCEQLLPKPVAQHKHAVFAWLTLFGKKCTAQDGLRTQKREQVRRKLEPDYRLRTTHPGERVRFIHRIGHGLEHVIASLPIAVVAAGDFVSLLTLQV